MEVVTIVGALLTIAWALPGYADCSETAQRLYPSLPASSKSHERG